MSKIKIRREGDQVIVERTYEVVPNNTVIFENRPDVDFYVIKNYTIRAIKARMEHCLHQLDTEILPSKDKVFNEMGAIFSPNKGLYFNQQSFESMESALEKIENNPLEDIFNGLTFEEFNQITKALIAFGDPCSNEINYLSALITEVLVVAFKDFSK